MQGLTLDITLYFGPPDKVTASLVASAMMSAHDIVEGQTAPIISFRLID